MISASQRNQSSAQNRYSYDEAMTVSLSLSLFAAEASAAALCVNKSLAATGNAVIGVAEQVIAGL